MECIYCQAPSHRCDTCGAEFVPVDESPMTEPCSPECAECAVKRVGPVIGQLALDGLVTIGGAVSPMVDPDDYLIGPCDTCWRGYVVWHRQTSLDAFGGSLALNHFETIEAAAAALARLRR